MGGPVAFREEDEKPRNGDAGGCPGDDGAETGVVGPQAEQGRGWLAPAEPSKRQRTTSPQSL